MARLKENDTVLDKWVLTTYEVPSKPELGDKAVWHFDRSKNPHGCWKVDHTPPKGYKHPKVKVNKTQSYGVPVAMVFKSSNRANAKTKMKVWNNTNIDYIITQDKLPGVPSNAVMLELGVGKSLIKKWQSKYNL
ncbi:MAG: hypothetical protein HKN40_02100 [Winogradskyella sp.]|uniref:hypothetical protein n=1 Tax=Winogradskyella sp. TaxID=1883156 RepID=UPI001848DD0A|nr:hypothetical protein [Winogradskyella sp.]